MIIVVLGFVREDLFGEFFFPPFLLTRVNPSTSFLSVLSSIETVVGAVSMVAAVAVVIIVVIGEFVVITVVVLVSVFRGQALEKCPSCWYDQHNCFLPLTNTIITWSLYLFNEVKPSPIEAHDESVVTICRPTRRCYLVDLFNVAIFAQVGSDNDPT